MTPARIQCSDCARPLPRCLCPYVHPTDNLCHLLILQHPKERGHPKNTGELLARSLKKVTLLQGEVFSRESLHPWLTDAILLYPQGPGTERSDTLPGSAPATALLPDRDRRHLEKKP